MSAPEMIPLNTFVPPFGHVVGVTYTGGERFYLLFDSLGVTSLIDEATVRASLPTPPVSQDR